MWDKPFMSTFEELDCEYMHYYLVFEQRNMARPRVQCTSSRGSLALDVISSSSIQKFPYG